MCFIRVCLACCREKSIKPFALLNSLQPFIILDELKSRKIQLDKDVFFQLCFSCIPLGILLIKWKSYEKRYLTPENSEDDIIITFVLFFLLPSSFPTPKNHSSPGERNSIVPPQRSWPGTPS